MPAIRYTATVSPGEDNVPTCIIIKSITGGVTGPCIIPFSVKGLTLPQMEDKLRKLGFATQNDWYIQQAYDGVRLRADVSPIGRTPNS